MLLKQCYIQGFGKLQDFTYEFTEGLNVICTENGWGKSTFAAFLRAMFYGLPQAGSRTKLEEAERRKYRPWNGGCMGGSLVFEVNEKEYRVERTFGKKESEDTFRLIDLSTNLESTDFSSELGKELFGLDKEAYSRSTYLPQNRINDGGMNDSIGKKLGRLAEGEEESGNFDKAYEALEELRKKYIPDRQKDEKGYVAVLTRKIADTQARLEVCRRKEESAKPWREKEQNAMQHRKELETQLVLCRERLEAAAGYEALAAKKKHYTELCGREESLRVQKNSMQGLFREGVPDLSELRLCRQKAEEAAVLAGELRSYRLEPAEQNELARLQRLFETGVPGEEELQDCIRTEAEVKEQLNHTEHLYQQTESDVKRATKQHKRCRGVAAVLFLLATVVLIAAFYRKPQAETEQHFVDRETVQNAEVTPVNVPLATIGAAVLLGGLVSLVLGLQNRKQEHDAAERLAEYSTEIERLHLREAKGRDVLTQYGFGSEIDITGGLYHLSDEIRRYKLLCDRKEKQDRCINGRDALLQKCTGMLLRYGMETEDITGGLHILENRTRDFLRISEELAEVVKKREHFEQETSPDSFFGVTSPEMSFAELQKTEQELLVQIARTTEEEKDCRERAEEFEKEAEACTELEDSYEELCECLEAKKREYFFITETEKCLKTAKEQFSSRYLRGLTTGFEKYLSLLGEEDFTRSMDGHFGGVRTDVNLNVQVTAYGEDKELGYFSTGIRDLLGICMRFALVDALFSEEQPFLVLDDPFVNLDKEKMGRAVDFLKAAAQHYQILYLVCHESRV